MNKEQEIQPAESDNYYRILGTTSKASPETIRKRYLERVRAFPPEENPEEFERVRTAYDTLKDPLKRSQYDLENKYGGRIKRLVERTGKALDLGNFHQARELLDEAQELAGSENVLLHILQGKLAVLENKLEAGNREFDRANKLLPENERHLVLLNKASILYENDYFDRALKVVRAALKQYPDQGETFKALLIDIYQSSDQIDKALKLLREDLPEPGTESIDDIPDFIYILSVLHPQGRWDEIETLRSRLEELLEEIQDAEIRYTVLEMLIDHCRSCIRGSSFRGANMFAGLVTSLAREDELEQLGMDIHFHFIQETIEQYIDLERDLDRLNADRDFFLPLVIKANQLYLEETAPWDESREIDLEAPSHIYEAMLEMDEAYLDGIQTLMNKYPHIYQAFQDEWEMLAEEHSPENRQEPEDRQLSFSSLPPEGYEKRDGTLIKTKDVGRNDPCPCGSGRKYKKCCGR